MGLRAHATTDLHVHDRRGDCRHLRTVGAPAPIGVEPRRRGARWSEVVSGEQFREPVHGAPGAVDIEEVVTAPPRLLAAGLALLLVVGAVIGVVTAVSALLPTDPPVAVAPQVPGSRPEAPTVVVREGETLWQLSERYAPAGADPRHYLAELERENGLRGSDLQPGMVLRLPSR